MTADEYPTLSAWPCGRLIHIGDPDREGTRTVTISTVHKNCERAARVLMESDAEGIPYHVREYPAPKEPQ